MNAYRRLLAGSAVAITTVALATSAWAETLHWADRTDPGTMDPHATNTAPVLSFLNNIYEGLVRRTPSMAVEGSLAESWEALGADGWRFHLRHGVTFHDGAAFTADDVLFSYERASSEQSDVQSWFAPIREVAVVDDHTIDFLTHAPNPLFPSSIANFMILDRDWAVANGAEVPARDAETFATLNANGTGPFELSDRVPDERTVLTPFAGWWDSAEHNLSEAVFTPISNDATRVAALLSGEIDVTTSLPLQDVPRLKSTDGIDVVEGIEARVLFFGFGHNHEGLIHGGEGMAADNPFTDVRVRQAVYQAIDADAIVSAIMRGNAESAALLVGSSISGYNGDLDSRLPFDPEAAQALLAEAGYGDGFSFGLRCPNNRYISDEAICTAVVGMLGRIGLEVQLIAEPVAVYWDNLRAGDYDMYLLGWSPGTFDAEHPIRFLLHTPDADRRLGSWNFGGYSNARIDELLPQIQVELDPATRQTMVDETHRILIDDVAYVPTHIQPLVWATRAGVSVAQRADNFFLLRWVTVE